MFPNPYSHRREPQPYQQNPSLLATQSKPSQDYSNHNPHSHPLDRQSLFPLPQTNPYIGTHQDVRQANSQAFYAGANMLPSVNMLPGANMLPSAYSECLDIQNQMQQQQQYAAMSRNPDCSYQGAIPFQQDGPVNYQLDPFQQFTYMNMPMNSGVQMQQSYIPAQQVPNPNEATSRGDRLGLRSRAMARQRGGYPPLEALNVDTRQVNATSHVTLNAQDDRNAIDRQEERPRALATEEMTVDMSCKVCMEQKADMFFEPCMHLAICKWCSDVWRTNAKRSRRTDPELRQPWKCPVCLKGIRQVRKVYF